MYRSMVCVQEFWFCVSDLDIQLEQSENDSPAREKSGSRLRETTSHIYTVFFSQLIRTFGSVIKVSLSESGNLGSIPDES